MKEYGRIGQKRWEGVFNEEFLPELSGIRGVKTYREMLDNDDTIGAIMFAIKMLIRQVKWHVEPGGDSRSRGSRICRIVYGRYAEHMDRYHLGGIIISCVWLELP